MEELFSVFSIAPIVLSVIALLSALIAVARRARAEAKFVVKLSLELKANVDRQKALAEEMRKKVDQLRPFEQKIWINSDVEGASSDGVKYSIKDPEAKGVADEIYHIYFSSVKGLGDNKELPLYVKDALHNLNKDDKRHIVKALSQPSARGRMRYFDKVFKLAFKAARG